MALRDSLLLLLREAFIDDQELRAFVDRHGVLVPKRAVARKTRSLAEQIVDDAMDRGDVTRLLDELLRARPGLQEKIAAAKREHGGIEHVPIQTAVGAPQQQAGLSSDRGVDVPPSPSTSEESLSGTLGAGGKTSHAAPGPPTQLPQSRQTATVTDDAHDPGHDHDHDLFAGSAESGGGPSVAGGAASDSEVPSSLPGRIGPTTLESDGLQDPSPSTDPSAPQQGPPPASPPPPRPLVEPQTLSLGFVTPEAPDAYLLKRQMLAAATRYLLWVEIAPKPTAPSLDGGEPMHGLRQDDELDVIVFPFPDQLALEGERHGRIQIRAGGNAVITPAYRVAAVASEAARSTLYFAVRTPDRLGRFALRVHVYCRGVLLQSHVVTAEVGKAGAQRSDAQTRKVDYNLSARLDASLITPDTDVRASLFINDDGRGTHSFRFVSSNAGVPEHVGDAHVDGGQLTRMVQLARKALRWSAWGTEEPWTSAHPCKFADKLDREKLVPALEGMARRGAQLYMQISEQFSFMDSNDPLREHMRAPGRVQIALKESPDAILPIALIYDYPLDSGLKKLSICETALDAIAAGKPLADEPCFQGRCPSYDKNSVVCPGGFWGFRHDLGVPLHLKNGEAAVTIPRGSGVRAFAPISNDAAFTKRDAHLKVLTGLDAQAGWFEILKSREDCLSRLKEARQLIYFYCHGGITESDKVPFLEVGDDDSDPILAQTLFNEKIKWPGPLRPLVILNGCHTTATSAEEIFSMLTAFASSCNAAGIIGTEITNFELIAGIFAEELLRRFLKGEQLGSCVRLARLELLRRGNPLGLIYIPFALPSLHLE
jgi:hypothetical protein